MYWCTHNRSTHCLPVYLVSTLQASQTSVTTKNSFGIWEEENSRNKWAATWQNWQSDCAPRRCPDEPWHRPSLIRVFAVRFMSSKRPKLSLCGQWRLWSDWADAQADPSLCWAHPHFWFCHVVAQISTSSLIQIYVYLCPDQVSALYASQSEEREMIFFIFENWKERIN